MGLPKATHPVHKMVLPSTQREVKFRPYLVKEEKLLLMATESNDELEMVNATKQVLRNCLLDEDLVIDDMTIFDMQWAFVQLRAKSVGEIADLKVICSKCEHPNDYQLNFADLEVIIPEDMDFRVPLTGDLGVTMRFPSVGILNEFTKQEMTKAENAIALIMACIENIYDENTVHNPRDFTLEEQTEWVESLGRSDMEKIEKFCNKIPTISKKVEFECTECKEPNTREIGGMADFF